MLHIRENELLMLLHILQAQFSQAGDGRPWTMLREQKSLEEPAGARQMPLRRPGVRHLLDGAVFRRKRQRGMADREVFMVVPRSGFGRLIWHC